MRVGVRSLVGVLFAAVLAAFALPATSDAAVAPMILLLHGGGWQSGGAAEMAPWAAEFAADGYRTRSLDYPLGNVLASIDYVDAIAQQERTAGAPVIAYGISAGGTIAAALAASGRVDGAVDVIGPTDFRRWISPIGLDVILNTSMTSAEQRAASPYSRLNGHQTPQLLQCGILDPITTYDQCMRYVTAASAGNPDTELQPMLDAHDQWPVDRKRARLWVQARWPAP